MIRPFKVVLDNDSNEFVRADSFNLVSVDCDGSHFKALGLYNFMFTVPMNSSSKLARIKPSQPFMISSGTRKWL